MKNGSGIVIEVQNKKATLLMKDGTFVTVRVPAGKRPLIGNEYQASYFSHKKRSLFVLPSISFSVAALIAFLFISGLLPNSSHSAAAAYVSFDINPSLEVGVDDNMRVVEMDAFNDEAKKIIKKYNFSTDDRMPFEVFADQLIKAYQREGYMEENQSMLITTVSDKSSDKKTKQELDHALDSIVKKAVVQYPVAITVSETNEEVRDKAKQLGVSSGKYTAFQEATKNDKHLKEEKIKEVKFQELKVNTTSSKNIKSVPHPRKIKAAPHEVKVKPVNNKEKKSDHQSSVKPTDKNLVKPQKNTNEKRNSKERGKRNDQNNNRNHTQQKEQRVEPKKMKEPVRTQNHDRDYDQNKEHRKENRYQDKNHNKRQKENDRNKHEQRQQWNGDRHFNDDHKRSKGEHRKQEKKHKH
ncbi:anti-sigma-I factor RsgI family protein [Fictibacillus phosphorivorans]|uniref:anti-sigma-I factor RsgI family protein n=1 Tax=Fictibacillus phosphorivorans TaxID=1221500 RepID=UPI0035EFDEB5